MHSPSGSTARSFTADEGGGNPPMPIGDQWWSLTEKIIGYEGDKPGVYELANTNEVVIYIGSTNVLHRRLKEHLAEPAGSCSKKNGVAKYRAEYTTDSQNRQRRLYDEHVRAYGRPPACNYVRP